jgi:hypothetical protein
MRLSNRPGKAKSTNALVSSLSLGHQRTGLIPRLGHQRSGLISRLGHQRSGLIPSSWPPTHWSHPPVLATNEVVSYTAPSWPSTHWSHPQSWSPTHWSHPQSWLPTHWSHTPSWPPTHWSHPPVLVTNALVSSARLGHQRTGLIPQSWPPTQWSHTSSWPLTHWSHPLVLATISHYVTHDWYFMIWVWRAAVEWYWQGKTEELGEETCPSATLSTTNPTWIDPGANLGSRGERPATNDVSQKPALARTSVADDVTEERGSSVTAGRARPIIQLNSDCTPSEALQPGAGTRYLPHRKCFCSAALSFMTLRNELQFLSVILQWNA